MARMASTRGMTLGLDSPGRTIDSLNRSKPPWVDCILGPDLTIALPNIFHADITAAVACQHASRPMDCRRGWKSVPFSPTEAYT